MPGVPGVPAVLLACVLVLASSTCSDDDCEYGLAMRYAPVFRLDKTSVTQQRCLPGSPATVYEARKAGSTEVICEDDPEKLDEVPIFYHYEECTAGVVVIDYWIWYSHQPACLDLKVDEKGAHKGDWERVVVHIKDEEIKAIRFHQHSGSYTKSRDGVEFFNSTHPISYVGQDSHGNYHDQGGTGNCLYFQDYRRFEEGSQLKVDSWNFLFNIKNSSQHLPAWFVASSDYLDGYPNAQSLAGRSGCNQGACEGTDSWVAATGTCTGKACGCRKSDYCEDVKFGELGEKEPCTQSFFNDASERLKDLFGVGGQVSLAESMSFGLALLLSMVLYSS